MLGSNDQNYLLTAILARRKSVGSPEMSGNGKAGGLDYWGILFVHYFD